MSKFLLIGAGMAAALAAAAGPASAQDRWDWDGGRDGDREYRLIGPGVPDLYPELRRTNRGRAFVMRNFDFNRDGRVNRREAEAGPWDAAWLDALEARMAEHGAAIAEARATTVAALSDRLATAPEGPFARALIAREGGEPAPLGPARARDAAAGRTLAGPHRADLLVTHQAKNQPAGLCSTGEQKALLIGLILAHADLVAERNQRRPILLLDEIAAHLDPVRRAALFARLDEAGGQVWMTGTEPALFDGIGAATRFTVADGRVG